MSDELPKSQEIANDPPEEKTYASTISVGVVRAAFFFPLDEEQLFLPLTSVLKRLRAPYRVIGEAFWSNVRGLLTTLSIPYTMAHTSALDRQWFRIHAAERIRAIPLPSDPPRDDAEQERLALSSANSEMDTFVHSSEGMSIIVEDTLRTLKRLLLSDSSLALAAVELILQGLVLCWSAFEVLARDVFVAYLNVNPNCVFLLMRDPVAKRRFEAAKISLVELAAHNFDVSTRLGTLLGQQQDLSDINSIKAVYQALFPSDDNLRDALSDSDFRLLSLRRNLIVHQCGIMDQSYTQSSQAPGKCGSKLVVGSDGLEKHLESVLRAGIAVLSVVATEKD